MHIFFLMLIYVMVCYSLLYSLVGALIDPGTDGYKLLRAIEKCQTNISKILLTHGHSNHVSCIMEVMRNFGSMPIYLVESEKTNLEKVLTSGSVMGDEVYQYISRQLICRLN